MPKKKKEKPASEPAKPDPADKPVDVMTMASRDHKVSDERYAELVAEATAMDEKLLVAFPGHFDRRATHFEKLHLVAERDKADLLRTPFPEDEPPMTQDELDGFLDQIAVLRVLQSQWTTVQGEQQTARVNFDETAEQAGQDKETLLKFFDLQFKNNPKGQKLIVNIRAGTGDSDFVQDVSDVLTLCKTYVKSVARGLKGESEAVVRLTNASPKLSYLLAAKTLTPKAQQARIVRDAMYTMLLVTERRIRAAGDYWYSDKDKIKDYAAFVPPASSSSDKQENQGGDQSKSGEDSGNPQTDA